MENLMEENKKISKKSRSAAYPSSSLSEAVEHLKKIHKDLGKGPYDRDSAAKSIGYSGVSGASASKIAALAHYGLIQRIGSGYIETELGTRIALSIDQEEESDALLEAFKSPTLFSKLFSDFGGKAIPAKLEIILVRQYRITEQASKDAAKAFRESAEFVGILKNGFLHETVEAEDVNKNAGIISRTVDPATPSGSAQNTPSYESGEVAFEVGPGIKVVFSKELMLYVATGKFSKGIEQLSKDLEDLEVQQKSTQTVVDDHEEPQL